MCRSALASGRISSLPHVASPNETMYIAPFSVGQRINMVCSGCCPLRSSRLLSPAAVWPRRSHRARALLLCVLLCWPASVLADNRPIDDALASLRSLLIAFQSDPHVQTAVQKLWQDH